mgnify:CR=1 FL=1
MNRIIIIGNGFDKAHGLATGYRDFIDSYWAEFFGHIFGGYWRWIAQNYGVINDPSPYEDEFVQFDVARDKQYSGSESLQSRSYAENPYGDVQEFIATLNDKSAETYKGSVRLTFKNNFFEHISQRCSLTNWVDIENEYYGKLKALLAEDNDVLRNEKVRNLNREFEAVKKKLESYLTKEVDKASIELLPSIREAFDSIIEPQEVAYGKQKMFVESILNRIVVIGKNSERGDIIHIDKQDDPDSVSYTHLTLPTT